MIIIGRKIYGLGATKKAARKSSYLNIIDYSVDYETFSPTLRSPPALALLA